MNTSIPNTSIRLSSLLFALLIIFNLAACATGSSERKVINPPRPGDLSYKELMLRDYEQMLKAVRGYIREAQRDFAADDESAGFNELKKALRLIFSRPDSDNVVAKLVPEVRRELSLYNAYYPVVHELAKEGVQAFDPSLGLHTVTLATYTFMLQNILGEIKAEARDNKPLQTTIQMIAEAKITVPKDVVQERKLSGMFLSESPSDQAQRVLTETLKVYQK